MVNKAIERLQPQDRQNRIMYKDVGVTVPRRPLAVSSILAATEGQHNYVYDNYYNPELLSNVQPVMQNGLMANLLDAKKTGSLGGCWELTMNITDFRLHKASLRNYEAGELAQSVGEGIPQGLIITARILTADGQNIISRRSDGSIGTIGGVFSPVEAAEMFGIEHAFNPYAQIIEEIAEETGIWSEFWSDLTGESDYVIRVPTNPLEVYRNMVSLSNIIDECHIQLSQVIWRDPPLNVPLLIFDVKLDLTTAELMYLHRVNGNPQLKELIVLHPSDESLCELPMTTELICCYPQIFPAIIKDKHGNTHPFTYHDVV